MSGQPVKRLTGAVTGPRFFGVGGDEYVAETARHESLSLRTTPVHEASLCARHQASAINRQASLEAPKRSLDHTLRQGGMVVRQSRRQGPFFDPQTSVGGSEDCERDLTSHLHESDFDLSDGEGMEDEEDRRRCEPLFDGVCPLSKTHWCSKQHAKTA